MGLAGRKVKQRIGSDPRNLSWADDANKFGTAYLQKLGWSAGTGLGTNGEGRTSHIKVSQKLDMLGIGAAHQKDPNGIAWKQNKDYENLLRRLNTEGAEGGDDTPGTKVDGFTKAGAGLKEEDIVEDGQGAMTIDRATAVVESKERRKRKRAKEDDSAESGESSKKSKKSKKEKKEGDGEKKSKSSSDLVASDSLSPSPATPAETSSFASASRTPAAGAPRRAHRARFMAAKRLALNSSSAMDEILGISRSGTSTPYPITSIPETPLDTPEEEVILQELTTSSKSVMDYFKEKLLAKSNAGTRSTSSAPDPSSSKVGETDELDDYEERPRGGLGLGASRGLGAIDKVEETTERRGLGISSRFASMFSSASTFVGASGEGKEDKHVEVKGVEEEGKKKRKEIKTKVLDGAEDGQDVGKESKKSKREKRRKAKGDGADVEMSSRKKRKEMAKDVDDEGVRAQEEELEDLPAGEEETVLKRKAAHSESGPTVEPTIPDGQSKRRKKDKDGKKSKAKDS